MNNTMNTVVNGNMTEAIEKIVALYPTKQSRKDAEEILRPYLDGSETLDTSKGVAPAVWETLARKIGYPADHDHQSYYDGDLRAEKSREGWANECYNTLRRSSWGYVL